ncbi:MAG: hypothetical protein JNL11_11140 [Bdellovibrionaceae bacterium]|nr:hypothetical protein [Pseudobdellovibrionaceae bacterium]
MKRIAKTLVLTVTGLLLMGNESCEKQGAEVPKARQLKKIVDVGQVASRMIDMPNGQKFDFQYVINQQIYPVLQESEGFWFRYAPPFNEMPSQLGSNIYFSNLNLSRNDVDFLNRTLETMRVTSAIKSDDISCLVNLPQYRIQGTINSFEMLNKVGLGIGFNQGGGMNSGGLGLNFGVETYQLDMNLLASHPLTAAVSAAANVTAKQTKTNVSFTLPISNLLLDPSFYFQTPLARVSYNALTNSVKQIQEQLKDKEWYTRVLISDEHVATILAGSGHNVQVGDVFDVYKETTMWVSNNGQTPVPCESEYKGSVDGDKPIATIEITSVNEELSNGRVIAESGYPIKMGSKVKIRQLAAPVTQTPKK